MREFFAALFASFGTRGIYTLDDLYADEDAALDLDATVSEWATQRITKEAS